MLDKPSFPYGVGFRSLTSEIADAGRAAASAARCPPG